VSAPRIYIFEGEPLTVAQIAQRVPLSLQTIRRHLAAGRNTRAAMEAMSTPAAQTARARQARRTWAPYVYGRRASSPPEK